MPLQTPVLALARLAEGGHSEGVNPWLVGGTALGLLLFMLLVVVGIGGGRDHS